jgi:hypothetical protein
MDVSNFYQVVSEADIDWIVCVELNSSDDFRKWLASNIFGHEVEHVQAWRSISDSMLGESDLIWEVRSSDGRKLIALIENKITATAQPEQCERYFKRAQNYKEEGWCHDYVTCIICPQSYSSADASDYNKRIAYEDIRSFFDSQSTERYAYLSSIFTAALAKRSSYLPPNQEITDFRYKIWELANKEFSHINLNKPSPCREYWVCQNYGEFTMKYKMIARQGEFKECHVDLELPGLAGELERLKEQYTSSAGTIHAHLVETGKSASFRISLPLIHPPVFEEQSARAALEAWSSLLTWWSKQRTT